VVKLSTDPATELRGSFFPQQLQYFLTLLPLGKSRPMENAKENP
jgi:hypothetical protein